MNMEDSHQILDAKISIRSKINLLKKIKDKLQPFPNRYLMFRDSVFGPWLDLKDCSNHSHMLNYVLQHQVHVKEVSADSPPILFKISNHYLHFGREEFCLVTGFICGEYSECESNNISFVDRIFSAKDKKQRKNVNVSELGQIINNDKEWSALDDEDAVRVCLLYVLEIVFMGREDFLNVPLHILSLANDFFAWNAFPWGEYMWRFFYKRTMNVVKIHAEKKVSKNFMTYYLNGFVLALKIWILESYPKSTLWWVKQPNVAPRGLAWSNFWPFQKTDYDQLFGQDSIPNLVLLPTSDELKADFFVRCQYYFKGEDAPFIQSFKPTVAKLSQQTSSSTRVQDQPFIQSFKPTVAKLSQKTSSSTRVQDQPIINEAGSSVQQNKHVLGNVCSSKKCILEPRILDTVDVLCNQLIEVRPEMNVIVAEIKSKVIDKLASTILSGLRQHPELSQSGDVNCDKNLDECMFVEKDVGVSDVDCEIRDIDLVAGPMVSKDVHCDISDMNLVDCPVDQDENIGPNQLTFTDTQASSMQNLVKACSLVSLPCPVFESSKPNNGVEEIEVSCNSPISQIGPLY